MGLFKNFTIKSGDAASVPLSPSFIKNDMGGNPITSEVNIWPSPTGQVRASTVVASSVLDSIHPYKIPISAQIPTSNPVLSTGNGIGTGLSIITTISDFAITQAYVNQVGNNYAPGDILQFDVNNAIDGAVVQSMEGFFVGDGNITGTLVTDASTKTFTPTGGSGSGFQCSFRVQISDGKEKIEAFTLIDAGTKYVVGDKLNFLNGQGQNFTWTLTANSIVILGSATITFELAESNFVDADLSIQYTLQPGEISTMRASKFTTNQVTDTKFLTMVNKTT